MNQFHISDLVVDTRAPVVQDTLARRGLTDLARRAERGVWIHTTLWLLLSVVGDWPQRWPAFFWVNTALFAGVMCGRIWLSRRLEAIALRDLLLARRLLAGSVLCAALHWGLTAAVVVFTPVLVDMRDTLYILMGSLAATGTMVLAIDPAVRRFYPWAILVPPMLHTLLVPTPHDVAMTIAAVVMAIYVMLASRTVFNDYWSAARARVEIEQRARQLERLSTVDALTQVANRFAFERRLAELWPLAVREGWSLAVLLIDLDHFKRVNDTFGHPAGDQVLRATALALRSVARREVDLLARFGGEEFVLLLPSTDEADALKFAEQLRAAVAAIVLDGPMAGCRLTCSIGVHVAHPTPTDSPDELLGAADAALYVAKAAGRNRVMASAREAQAAL
jgi:diguanylate cyclase (GGDEF)-like protein